MNPVVPPTDNDGVNVGVRVLEPTTLNFADAVACPTAVLALTVQVADGTDVEASARDVTELLCDLSDLDRALGGRGLVLDRSRSQVQDGTFTLVLRPLVLSWSPERLTAIANVLSGPDALTPEPPVPASANGVIDRLATVLEERRQLSEPPGARSRDWAGQSGVQERVRSWRGGRNSVTGLRVEAVVTPAA